MNYALVTGGGGGLGFELVKEHLKAGFTVFALEINVSDQLKNLQENAPERLFIEPCDIGSTESVEKAMEDVKAHTDIWTGCSTMRASTALKIGWSWTKPTWTSCPICTM